MSLVNWNSIRWGVASLSLFYLARSLRRLRLNEPTQFRRAPSVSVNDVWTLIHSQNEEEVRRGYHHLLSYFFSERQEESDRAFHALKNFLPRSSRLQSTLSDNTVLYEELVAVLASQRPYHQYTAIQVLLVLVENIDTSLYALCELGLAQSLLTAVNQQSHVLHLAATSLFDQICSDDGNIEFVRGVVPEWTRALLRMLPTANLETQKKALHALLKMSVTPQFREEAKKLDIFGHMATSLRSTDDAVAGWAVGIVHDLMSDASEKEKASAKCAQALCELLYRPRLHPHLIRWVMATLAAVCPLPAGLQNPDQLVRALAGHAVGSDAALSHFAVIALCAIKADNAEMSRVMLEEDAMSILVRASRHDLPCMVNDSGTLFEAVVNSLKSFGADFLTVARPDHLSLVQASGMLPALRALAIQAEPSSRVHEEAIGGLNSYVMFAALRPELWTPELVFSLLANGSRECSAGFQLLVLALRQTRAQPDSAAANELASLSEQIVELVLRPVMSELADGTTDAWVQRWLVVRTAACYPEFAEVVGSNYLLLVAAFNLIQRTEANDGVAWNSRMGVTLLALLAPFLPTAFVELGFDHVSLFTTLKQLLSADLEASVRATMGEAASGREFSLEHLQRQAAWLLGVLAQTVALPANVEEATRGTAFTLWALLANERTGGDVAKAAQRALSRIAVGTRRLGAAAAGRVELSPAACTPQMVLDADHLTFRNDFSTLESARSNHPVSAGRWYYEVTLRTDGVLQLGWTVVEAVFLNQHWLGTGDDELSFAYDGNRQMRWHTLSNGKYGREWHSGDTIGCCLDLQSRTISFTQNGEDLRVAFTDLPEGRQWLASVTADEAQEARCNFGATPFKFAIPAGYRALADAAGGLAVVPPREAPRLRKDTVRAQLYFEATVMDLGGAADGVCVGLSGMFTSAPSDTEEQRVRGAVTLQADGTLTIGRVEGAGKATTVATDAMFRAGDVVGCGLVRGGASDARVFFTVNGALVYVCDHGSTYLGVLPSVAPVLQLSSQSARARLNFGVEPFVYAHGSDFGEIPMPIPSWCTA